MRATPRRASGSTENSKGAANCNLLRMTVVFSGVGLQSGISRCGRNLCEGGIVAYPKLLPDHELPLIQSMHRDL
jgi:hypothetical protein